MRDARSQRLRSRRVVLVVLVSRVCRVILVGCLVLVVEYYALIHIPLIPPTAVKPSWLKMHRAQSPTWFILGLAHLTLTFCHSSLPWCFRLVRCFPTLLAEGEQMMHVSPSKRTGGTLAPLTSFRSLKSNAGSQKEGSRPRHTSSALWHGWTLKATSFGSC